MYMYVGLCAYICAVNILIEGVEMVTYCQLLLHVLAAQCLSGSLFWGDIKS